MGKMVWVKDPPKTKAGGQGHWSEKVKLTVLTQWMAHGNLSLAAQDNGVPYNSAVKWKESDWWKDKVKQLESDDLEKMDRRLSKVIDKALDNLLDRIENGDAMYDPRTGEMRRVPAKLRDLNSAFTNVLDKRQLLRKQPTKIVEQQSTAAQLQNLAAQFASFVNGSAPKETITDAQEHFIQGENVIESEEGGYELKI